MSEAIAQMPEDTLGQLMVECRDLQLEYKAAKKVADELEKALKEKKFEIIDALQTQGTMMTKVEGVGTASISTKVVSNTTDWEAVGQYAVENAMPELFQKRINQGAYKELRDRGIEIPGLEDYEAVTLNFRVST